MRYVLLIYGSEAAAATATEEQNRAEIETYNVYTQELRDGGVITGGEALLPTSTATTVQLRDGKMLTTHGPFAETTEQLGGFYIISCDNLDQALEWAAKNPGAQNGKIEVRPIMEF